MIEQIGRLGRTTAVYGLGQVILRFISLLLLPLFTSYLTPTEYGISAMLGLISFVITPIFSLGLGTAIGICFFEHDDQASRSKVIWTSFAILFASVSLLLLLLIPSAPVVSELVFHTPEYAYFVKLNAIAMGVGILVNPFLYFLQFEERAVSYVVITVVVGLVSIGLSILFVVHLRQGLQGVLVATVLSQALALILFLLWSARLLVWGLNRDIGRRLLVLGLPFVPSYFFLFVIMQGNKYLLQSSRGLDELGVFNIGVNLGSVMNLLVGAFTTAWTPYFLSFSNKQDEARALFGRLTGYYIILFGLISLGFYVGARPLVLLLTAAPYHGAFVSVGPTATAQFLTGIFSMLLPAMYFAQDVRYVVVVQAVAMVAAVVVGFAFIPTAGVVGAALTPVAGMLAMVIAQVAWNHWRRATYLQVTYPWTHIIMFLVGYGVLASILLWDRDLDLQQELLLSVGAAVVAILLAAGLVPAQDRRAGIAFVRSQIQRLRSEGVPEVDKGMNDA